MLRAVISSKGKRAYFDFCGTWEKLEKAVRKVVDIDYISYLTINHPEIDFEITKYSKDIFEKVELLIASTDSIYDIYFVCKKLQYDDIGFKELFQNDETCSSIADVRNLYIKYAHDKFNQKESNPSIKNPNELSYEAIKLFGHKVLFTEWRLVEENLLKELFKYEVMEENGSIIGISEHIICNHFGTIISDKPIKLDTNDYKSINELKDIIYSEEPGITLKQYIHESKQLNKSSLLR